MQKYSNPKSSSELKPIIDILNNLEITQDDKVKIIDFKPKNSLELMLIVDDFELKIPKNIQDKIFKYYSK